MFDEGNENLPYLSSPRTYGGAQKTTNPDEADISTLERLLQMIDEKIDLRDRISRIDVRDPKFTSDQQIAMNQQMAQDFREFKVLVESAIQEVKEV